MDRVVVVDVLHTQSIQLGLKVVIDVILVDGPLTQISAGLKVVLDNVVHVDVPLSQILAGLK
eukprot:352842-Heterocapsa_arctica.AAC.1